MKEWADPFNSFNSLKGLLYRKWMEGVLAGDFLPPIEASIDPVYDCNLDCRWCNSKVILKNKELKGKRMSREHLLKLCAFLALWGVKGVCFAGGGEPFLHENLAEATIQLAEAGVDTAFLTNGTVVRDRDIEAMTAHSRWVGCSIDAATKETYAKLKNCDPTLFDRAIDFLKEVVRRRNTAGSRLEISYKLLLHPGNAHEIYDAAVKARDIGVDYVHMRPAACENILGGADFRFDFPIDSINRQMEKAFTLETDKFKVYGIRHKFSPSMNLDRRFSRCLAAPLLINLGADGEIYLCVDQKGKKAFSLGGHYPDPEEILTVWGGQRHKEMMKNVNLNVCPRCTFGIYNEIMEKTLVEDRMCRNFP